MRTTSAHEPVDCGSQIFRIWWADKELLNARAHGAEHELPGGKRLIDSYHCSRYNQNTRRLDSAMFEAVFERACNGR